MEPLVKLGASVLQKHCRGEVTREELGGYNIKLLV